MPEFDELALRRAFSISAAAKAIGVSRSHLYTLRARGEIGFAEVGGRSIIPGTEIERYRAELERRAERDRVAHQADGRAA